VIAYVFADVYTERGPCDIGYTPGARVVVAFRRPRQLYLIPAERPVEDLLELVEEPDDEAVPPALVQ
jgi:hypothetical protein